MEIQYHDEELFVHQIVVSTHMISNNLPDVVLLCSRVELPKVIDKRPHAVRKVKDSVYQLPKWDFSCRKG